MAHFAKLDENNIVIEKIVADQEFVDTLEEHMFKRHIILNLESTL